MLEGNSHIIANFSDFPKQSIAFSLDGKSVPRAE